MVVGISPNKLFSDTSNSTIFFKLPTFIGRMPVNELCDKLSPSNWEERIVLGMVLLRLFSEEP